MKLTITLRYTFDNHEPIVCERNADDVQALRHLTGCYKVTGEYCCEDDTPCYCDVCKVEREFNRLSESIEKMHDEEFVYDELEGWRYA